MDTSRCLRQLMRVRKAASDPGSAYVLRSRLKRAILMCLQDIGQEKNGVFIDSSSDQKRENHLGGRAALIGASCARLHQMTRRLCQPSEALTIRWRRAWGEVEQELGVLENLLKQEAEAS
jgi:hypothetical protein